MDSKEAKLIHIGGVVSVAPKATHPHFSPSITSQLFFPTTVMPAPVYAQV